MSIRLSIHMSIHMSRSTVRLDYYLVREIVCTSCVNLRQQLTLFRLLLCHVYPRVYTACLCHRHVDVSNCVHVTDEDVVAIARGVYRRGIDMYMDIRIYMCTDNCIHMCMDMCTDKGSDICIDTHTGFAIGNRYIGISKVIARYNDFTVINSANLAGKESPWSFNKPILLYRKSC